jgi:hypothetical protein
MNHELIAELYELIGDRYGAVEVRNNEGDTEYELRVQIIDQEEAERYIAEFIRLYGEPDEKRRDVYDDNKSVKVVLRYGVKTRYSSKMLLDVYAIRNIVVPATTKVCDFLFEEVA